jgi:hypothetical protein
MVYTWKLNGCPTLPVALVLLAMNGPAGGTGCTVMGRVAVVVPAAFEAFRPTGKVPTSVGTPMIAARLVSNFKPGGNWLAPSVVAPSASN